MAERTSIFDTVVNSIGEPMPVGNYWLNLSLNGEKIAGICLDKKPGCAAQALRDLIDEGVTTLDAGPFEIRLVRRTSDADRIEKINSIKSLLKPKAE